MAQYEFNPEEIRQLMRQASGTNLAGQSMAGPVATGQSYAQSIAGGMPMEQVIAPGVSYSPEMAGGYTQKDLDMIAAGPAPVMPIAPTTGEVATIDNQMPYAPPGVTQPTPFNIGNTLFPNVDYLQGLDFSGLPALGNIDVDAIIKEYQDRQDAGEPEPFESFFTEFSQAPVMPQAPVTIADSVTPGLFDITPELIAKQIEKQKIETAEPIYDRYIEPNMPGEPEPFFEPTVAPIAPVQTLPQNIFANIPQPVIPQPIPQIPNFPIQQLGLPMNFTGLPNIPVMPNIPVPPAAQVYIPPPMPVPPAYTQPRVEDIIAPIRSGGKRSFQQPGLFNLA